MIILSNLHKNLCCGCSLESPHRGDPNGLTEAILMSTNNIGFHEEIIRGYYMTEVCLLVILALDSHIGTRALARVPMWLSSANITKRHTSDIS